MNTFTRNLMLLKLLIPLAFLGFSNLSFGQEVKQVQQQHCALDRVLHRYSPSDRKTPPLQTAKARTGETIYIRTVVHVVYHDDNDNIDDTVIEALIEDVNATFRQEIDTLMIEPSLRSRSAGTNIQFCLTNIDPEGNPTNGITHTYTEVEGFAEPSDTLDEIKNSDLGGVSPWDTTRYYNIWIGEIDDENNVLNYAVTYENFEPISSLYGVPPGSIKGAVLDVNIFTQDFPGLDFTPRGVLAHEIGHTLGLPHTHGDPPDPMADPCDFDDLIEDTPLTGNGDITCLSGANSCIEPVNDPLDNVSNIMYYGCTIMITKEQGEAMYNNIVNWGPPEMWLESTCPDLTTSTDETAFDLAEVTVFPNPNTGRFTVSFNNNLAHESTLSLYDLMGRVIKEVAVPAHSQYTENWDIAVGQGLYLLKVASQKQSKVQKVIVQ